ncbi:phosphoribosylformylglycinamidine synthase subunit PurS [Elusimicrobiota bacterium]
MNSIKRQYYFEVFSREEDIRGNEIRSELNDLNLARIKQVYTSRIYILEGLIAEPRDQVLEKIACQILSDTVVEDYSFTRRSFEGAEVIVRFKPEVLNIEALRVLEALDIMDMSGIDDVKTAARYIIEGDEKLNYAVCSHMCSKVIYNKVIQSAEVVLE